MKDYIRNSRPFNQVCHNSFGRQVIYTNEKKITSGNVVKELTKALSTHRQNAEEIDYLYNYYLGNQPVLYRQKQVRPEINNKVVQNTAYFIVETKTADIASEPIQYVLRGTDEKKSEEIANLNNIMENEDKAYSDICLARWRSICGTSYRFISNDDGRSSLLDETEFRIDVLDPRNVFVVYFNNNVPAFSVQLTKDEKNKNLYYIYTRDQWFIISANKIIDSGTNGFLAIPVIIDDLFNKLLVIQGIANREGNTGGDTMGAVNLRNGYIDSEKRAELSEPSFKKAEKDFLRIVLYTMSVRNQTSLKISDIEIKISRSKMDNMLTKAETLKLLLDSGIYPERALKSVGFFADPEQVAIESKKRFDILYPQEAQTPNETVEVVDEVR